LDSDLSESISALREAFVRRGVPAQFGKAEVSKVEELRALLKLPRRFREFLLAADPTDVETRTPAERVRLIPAERLCEEQSSFALDETGKLRGAPAPNGWRQSWIIIAHSTLLGDP
jgi:hypothetical protein